MLAKLEVGKFWRLGKDEVTVLSTPVDLAFGSTKIPEGNARSLAQESGARCVCACFQQTGDRARHDARRVKRRGQRAADKVSAFGPGGNAGNRSAARGKWRDAGGPLGHSQACRKLSVRTDNSRSGAIASPAAHNRIGDRNAHHQRVRGAVEFRFFRIETEQVLGAELFGNLPEHVVEILDVAGIQATGG